MTLLQSKIWIDNLMKYLLLWLKRNLLKIICFYFFFEFFTNHGGISVELIIITKNSLLNKLLDMKVQREFNVHHKGISVARKTLIFAYFLWNCATRFMKSTNLICLVSDGASFYKKCFFDWKVKFSISNFRKMRKKIKKEKENET